MRKLFRIILIVFIAVICLTAYLDSRENGKSFWYNAGHRIKVSAMYVYDNVKPMVSDASKGFKEK